jgi:hypothetical protein
MEPNTPTTDDLTHHELVRRVVHALLGPAVRMGVAHGVPLKELARLLESAHFAHVRQQSATLRDTARKLGISERSAERLSQQAREAFVLPELKHHLPRRIEFILAAAPMSVARLQQVLSDVSESEVQEAVDELKRQGRVTESGDRTVTYTTTSGVRSLPRDGWIARVGGLTSFAENLANAAWGRFFANDPRSFARTLSFRLTPAQLAELNRWYSEVMLPQIVAWNEAAEAAGDNDDVQPMQLSLCWAPYEAMASTNNPKGER